MDLDNPGPHSEQIMTGCSASSYVL